jgi:acyl-coenzyme A thioesterase PaaI-like protein
MMKLQPSARNCFVCGVENDSGLHLRFYETEDNPPQVVAHYTIQERFQGYPGVAHGGILATMLDEVTSRTVFRVDPPRFVVTARLTMRYRKPVPLGTSLKLVGRVVEDKGRVITVAGQIIDPDGVVLTEAEAVLFEVDHQQFFESGEMAQESWEIYPETDHNPPGDHRMDGTESQAR